MVSTASMLCMAVSALIAIVVPIVLLVYWRKRTGAKLLAALAGAITFVVFVYGLENGLHQACIFGDNPVSRFILNTNWAYVLYAGFAAGIFEETGRFIVMKLFFKRMDEKKNGVMYGVGHGGIESILVAGVSMIISVVLALQLNAQGADALLAMSPGQETALTASLQTLTSNPAAMYLVSGLERCIAICLHIALSVLVFLAARRKGKGWLFPTAILLHAGVDCVAGLYHIGVLPSVWVVEAIVFAFTAAVALWAWRLYRADRDPDKTVPAPEPESLEAENA